MQIELTRISGKGQVVIPASLRKEMRIRKSDQFLVFGDDGTVILKKVEKAAVRKTLDEIAEPIHRATRRIGLTRADVKQAIEQIRNRASGRPPSPSSHTAD